MQKLALILSIVIMATVQVSAQSWQWAVRCGGLEDDNTYSICQDNAGNTYVTGFFYGPLGLFGSTYVSAMGSADLFISKYDISGNHIWTKRAGGNNISVNVFEEGSIYYDSATNSLLVLGNIGSSFGSVSNCNYIGPGSLFISRLDLNGNCIYSDVISSFSTFSVIREIVFDGIGNVYMYGRFYFSGFIGPPGANTPIDPGLFLAKYDLNTNTFIWSKNITDESLYPISLCTYNNDLFISGNTQYGSFTIDQQYVPCYPNDNFIARFNNNGNLQWVKTMGGIGYESGTAISLDSSGNIYSTGIFENTAYFGNDTLVSVGRDYYITKLDQSGNFIWSQKGNTLAQHFSFISSDPDGSFYCTGIYSGSISWGAFTNSTSNSKAGFITRFRSDGTCLGMLSIENAEFVMPLSLGANGCAVIGSFENLSNFGSFQLISHGPSDGFIAMLDEITGFGETSIINNQLSIMSNPNKGSFKIRIPDEFQLERELEIKLFSMEGKYLLNQKIIAYNEFFQFNLDLIAKGIYLIVLSNGKKEYRGKVVIQ